MDSVILRDLFLQMEWADAEVWRTLMATPAARADLELRDRLHHLHTVQHAFRQLGKGEAVDIPHRTEFADAAALLPWARQGHTAFAAFVEGVEAGSLDRPVEIPWAEQLSARWGASPASATLRDTLLQVAAHSAYHRGQVNTRLRALGAEPPLTDYIAWVWMHRPRPRWPEGPAQ